jgi:hypothetical protein
MILLSAKLDAARSSAQPESRATSPEEQGGVSLAAPPLKSSPFRAPDIQPESETSDATGPESHHGVAVTVTKKKKKSKKKSAARTPTLQSGIARYVVVCPRRNDCGINNQLQVPIHSPPSPA